MYGLINIYNIIYYILMPPPKIFKLEDYKKLLLNYKKNNFEVINFTNFTKKYSDYSSLPSKIVLLRHDIHYRDIENAYKMIQLEQEIFNKNVCTYFVQWNFMGSTSKQESYEKKYSKYYIVFIKHCIKNNIDVLPHISLFCNSFKNLYNRNRSNTKFINMFSCKIDNKDIENKEFFNICDCEINLEKNYYIYCKNNSKIDKNELKIKLNILMKDIEIYLENYKNNWYNKFGFYPKYYSCHGDGIELTKKLNPNNFASILQLENKMINVNSCKTYIGNSSLYKLNYKSDGSCNIDIINKQLFNNENKFQLLIHPYLWSKTN